MAAPTIFRIPVGTSGAFALSIVDRDAGGYLDSWQAPGGLRLPAAELSDYESDSGTWVCQVTSAALTASPNITTTERAGTFCSPPANSVTVGEDDFTMDIGYFQDPNVDNGLTAFLFEHRTQEAFVYFGADGDNPPRMIGRVRLSSGSIGGDAYTDLTATASFPLMSAPDIEFGTSTGGTRVVRGDGGASSALSAAGGSFAPVGATIPANFAALVASGIVAVPATAWTTGQKVTLGDTTLANWSGTAWAVGAHA